MPESPYKQLHEIQCGPVKTSDRLNLVDGCPNGYIATATDEAILLFNVERYLKANSECSLRKDKPLPNHPPDVLISATDPVYWLAFNNEGLVLAVSTSDTSKGTFVHLIDLKKALKHNACQLSDVSRPIRVCGGEGLTADGQPGWEIRDFAWNPTIPTLFVIILRSGAVRLLNATASATEPDELVEQLPSTVDARCLSWSTKGKQLAVCITGTLTTQTGPMSGPLILQTDPKLRLKRVVQLNTLVDKVFAGSVICPLDILWTSPSCFIIGVKSISTSSSNTMRAVMIHAPTRSTEVSYFEIPDLRLQLESTHCQYYWRAMGSGHFIATQSAGGEQLHVIQIPPGSATSPSSVAQVELPPTGFVLGLAMSFYWPPSSSEDRSKVVTYLITRLSNGNLAPFVLRIRDLLSPIIAALPEPVELPIAPTPPATFVSAFPPQSASQESFQLPNTTESNLTSQIPTSVFSNKPEEMPLNSAFPGLTKGSLSVALSQKGSIHVDTPTLTVGSTDVSENEPTTQQSCSLPSSTIVARKPQDPRLLHCTSSSEPLPVSVSDQWDVPLPKSLHIAAAQFSAALQVEAESGRAAWRDLFEMMIQGRRLANLSNLKSTYGESSGVDVTESKLHDTELFFKALDDVLCELKSSSSDRKDEINSCIAYASKVRKALRLCAAGDWLPIMTGHLDPESARLLGHLKRKLRLAESGLFDLDNHLQALSSEFKQQLSSPIRSVRRSGVEMKVETKTSTPISKLLSVVDTTTRLLQTERSRIEYINEGFKRFQRLNDTPMKEIPRSVENSFSTPRTSHSRGSRLKPTIPTLGGHPMNPEWYSLVQRDRALYRLFAKHQLPTVHAQFPAPIINESAESNAVDAAVTAISAAASEHAVAFRTEHTESPQPSLGERSLNNPQQVKLDKLVNLSGKAANANSPPSTKSSSLQASPNTCASFGQTVPSALSSPFIVRAPPVRVAAPSTVPSIGESTKPLLFTSAPSTPTVGSTKIIGSPFTVPKAGTSTAVVSSPATDDQTAVQPAGSFRLGIKTATGKSPVSPNLVVQKSIAPSPNALSFAVRTSTPTTITVEASPVSPSVPLQGPQETQFSGFTLSTSTEKSPATEKPSDIFIEAITSSSSTETSTTVSKTRADGHGAPVTTEMSISSPFSFLSPSNVIHSSLSGATDISQLGATATTATTGLTTTAPSTTGSTVTATTSSVFSLPLFGTASKTQPGVTTAASTVPTPSVGGLFQFGSPAAAPAMSASATTTVAVTTTTASVELPLFGTQPSTPTFGTPAFGSTAKVATAAVVTTTNNAGTNSLPLFGAPPITNPGSGGLFGSLKVASTVASEVPAGFLFGSSTIATGTGGGGLFGTTTVKPPTTVSEPPGVAGLFGSSQTTATGAAVSGGLFGTASTATTTANQATTSASTMRITSTTAAASTGVFGNSLNTTSAPTSGLFGPVAATSAPAAAGLFGLAATASSAMGTGLFGAKNAIISTPTTTTVQSNATPPNLQQTCSLFGALGSASQQNASGGLFGSNAGTKEINSLFSGSTFGLGSATGAPQTPVQNVFGRSTTTSAPSPGLFGSSVKPGGAGLFGAPAFSPNATSLASGTGLFSSISPAASGGLFGSVGASDRGGLFGTAASATATTASTGLFGGSTAAPTNTGGLFSGTGAAVSVGGLFSSSTSGGFGSRPVFDNSGFSSAVAQPSFGAAAFGSASGSLLNPNPLSVSTNTGTLFGSSMAAPAPAAEGLFSGLAAKTDSLSFGRLAMGSPTSPAAPASPFGSSPSFTQRRA